MTREHRYYSVDAANELVPWLEQCFGRILQIRSQMRGLYSTLEGLGARPDEDNLMRTDGTDEVRSARAKFVGLMELLQEELVAISEQGIEIKDLDTGLCDFWSINILPGREVYLCWRYGEKRIDYYHEPHAGFAGRKPLPPRA